VPIFSTPRGGGAGARAPYKALNTPLMGTPAGGIRFSQRIRRVCPGIPQVCCGIATSWQPWLQQLRRAASRCSCCRRSLGHCRVWRRTRRTDDELDQICLCIRRRRHRSVALMRSMSLSRAWCAYYTSLCFHVSRVTETRRRPHTIKAHFIDITAHRQPRNNRLVTAELYRSIIIIRQVNRCSVIKNRHSNIPTVQNKIATPTVATTRNSRNYRHFLHVSPIEVRCAHIIWSFCLNFSLFLTREVLAGV